MSRHTGFANLPLHPGRAPAWLFSRMTRLARAIAEHVVADGGPEEMLRRLSDPFWSQAFGCVLGFDWHSSGVTTTVTGALKEGLKGRRASPLRTGGRTARPSRSIAPPTTGRSTRCTARWRTQRSIARRRWTR